MATVPGARVVDGEIVDDETVVWAKVRGYPWWPATVKAACDPFGVKAKKDKKKSVQARFFGTDQLCGVKICDLKPFDPEAELLPGKVIDEKLAHPLRISVDQRPYSSGNNGCLFFFKHCIVESILFIEVCTLSSDKL